MANPVGTITRAATRQPDEPLNILTFPTHERWESGVCLTGHRFWAVRAEGIKDWNTTYAPIPENYVLLNPARKHDQLPPEIDFDVVLAQSIGQFPIAKRLSRQFHIPLIRLEHTLPVPQWNRVQKEHVRRMRGDINVFISEFSREAWGFGEQDVVIHHGVDTDLFTPGEGPRRAHALSVVNDWVNRDWCCGYNLWRQATKDIPTKVVGDTPGLSKPAKNVAELVSAYQESVVFVNTSLISPVPTALLEAMSAGCAVVSTATCMIPEIITNGVNGFISNEPSDLAKYTKQLLADPKMAEEYGKAARATILHKFSMPAFVAKWNQVFSDAAQVAFTG